MAFYRKTVFPLLAGLLWAAFLVLDLTGLHDSTWVKFAAICLCYLTALLGTKTADGKLVAAALCFTVIADWFLLVRNVPDWRGIWLFIVVQLLYAYRLYLLREKRHYKWGLALRLATLIPVLCLLFSFIIYIFATIAAWGHNPELAHFLSYLFPLENVLYLTIPLSPFFYFLNLCTNTFEAFALKRRTFAWGLLLFICCDICVGAHALGLLTSFTWWGSWLFYLPSQVLIVLSQEENI